MIVKIALTKLSNLFKFIISLFIIFIIRFKKNEIIPGSLLIIRLDVIGDYVLFRNYLKTVRISEKYRNCRITLCGNILWKDIAETFDKEVVNSFIWVERKKFSENIFYKHKMLVDIYTEGFEIEYDSSIVTGAKQKSRNHCFVHISCVDF